MFGTSYIRHSTKTEHESPWHPCHIATRSSSVDLSHKIAMMIQRTVAFARHDASGLISCVSDALQSFGISDVLDAKGTHVLSLYCEEPITGWWRN